MKTALIQYRVMETPEENLKIIEKQVMQAAKQGAELVVLPEMCCCYYKNSAFTKYCMGEDSAFLRGLSDCAKENGIILAGGTVPETEGDKLYNTCFVFDAKGKILKKVRKAHLFNIAIEGGLNFSESDTFSPGDEAPVIDLGSCKIGIMICFDVRFPEWAEKMQDADVIIVPAAFSDTTGVHWETLFKCRALDNQLYMAGCAPAPNLESGYSAYGHSIAVDPWGKVIEQLGKEEEIIIFEVDPSYKMKVREELPVLKNKIRV